jgi:hypothetical protein
MNNKIEVTLECNNTTGRPTTSHQSVLYEIVKISGDIFVGSEKGSHRVGDFIHELEAAQIAGRAKYHVITILPGRT